MAKKTRAVNVAKECIAIMKQMDRVKYSATPRQFADLQEAQSRMANAVGLRQGRKRRAKKDPADIEVQLRAAKAEAKKATADAAKEKKNAQARDRRAKEKANAA